MTDDRDICERLEDASYDGAFAMRREAAKLIRQLRHYTTRLEHDLVKLELAVENLREYIAQQQLDIISLGQQVGRLREALKEIEADCSSDYPPSHGAIKYAARVALGEEKKK
jgi:hypothetical protein